MAKVATDPELWNAAGADTRKLLEHLASLEDPLPTLAAYCHLIGLEPQWATPPERVVELKRGDGS